MTDKQITGKEGENAAVDFYLKNGYTILETNWRYGQLEIDIIAQNRDCIIFCEVKTRSGNYYGNPEEFVTKQKQNNIMRAADNYLRRKNILLEARFDIIAILTNNKEMTINHIPNAFTPRW